MFVKWCPAVMSYARLGSHYIHSIGDGSLRRGWWACALDGAPCCTEDRTWLYSCWPAEWYRRPKQKAARFQVLFVSLSLSWRRQIPFSIVRPLRGLRRPKDEGHTLLSYEYEFPSWCVTALRRIVDVIFILLLGMTALWVGKMDRYIYLI